MAQMAAIMHLNHCIIAAIAMLLRHESTGFSALPQHRTSIKKKCEVPFTLFNVLGGVFYASFRQGFAAFNACAATATVNVLALIARPSFRVVDA